MSISDEHDDERRRIVRVARISGPAVKHPMVPLHDVQLLGSRGGVWSLAGYERVRDGPLQMECVFGQTWILTPAPDEDLRRLEIYISELARRLHAAGCDVPVAPRANS